MRKLIILSAFVVAIALVSSFAKESLRSIYSRPATQWPKPFIDSGVQWTELGVLPASPVEKNKDSLEHIIELGKALFFDTRLSGSGKISCGTCHQPELNWTDGKEKSIGHDGAINKSNSPTIQNSWFYNRLFWDGRSTGLQDQAFGPINSETEMHSEMPEVISKLRRVKQYREMFKKAFGDDFIEPDRMTTAIATFEKTIISRKTRFDEFLEGNKNALTNSEIRGLHIFRIKARCMNCHYGALFTDNQFHNAGFSGNDAGRYKVSHKGGDVGKFKTPSLRDVMKTGPWMHDGAQADMGKIIESFDKGAMSSNTDKLIRPLGLSRKEKEDLLAFMNAISAPPVEFIKPVIPD